jgi:hypothetical protein
MKIQDHPNGKIVTLSKGLDTRPKMLHLIYFAVFFLGGLLFLRMIQTSDRIDNNFQLILSLLVPAFMIMVAYRFANKAVQSEKLIVSKHNLTLVKAGLFTSQKRSYDVKLIENFRHLATTGTVSKHPLAGDSFDYTGFQVREQLANSVHQENRLAFDYKGSTVKFGENIYSYEFEELEAILYEITGSYFRNAEAIESSFDAADDNL